MGRYGLIDIQTEGKLECKVNSKKQAEGLLYSNKGTTQNGSGPALRSGLREQLGLLDGGHT